MIAHIAGLPVEEVAMTMLPAAGAVWVAITARARRRAGRRPGGKHGGGDGSA